MLTALILFLATYAGLLAFPKFRTHIALGSAALFVILGILPVARVLPAVDWNVIMMIAGTMGIVFLFIESKMPSLMADVIIQKMPTTSSGSSSRWRCSRGSSRRSFDNVATGVDGRLGGAGGGEEAGHLAGPRHHPPSRSRPTCRARPRWWADTTSILLGGYAGMDFLDFFVYKGAPGCSGCGGRSDPLRDHARLRLPPVRAEGEAGGAHRGGGLFPTWLLLGTVVLLILASFLPEKPRITNGLICTGLMVIGVSPGILPVREPQGHLHPDAQGNRLVHAAAARRALRRDRGHHRGGRGGEIAKLFVRISGATCSRFTRCSLGVGDILRVHRQHPLRLRPCCR